MDARKNPFVTSGPLKLWMSLGMMVLSGGLIVCSLIFLLVSKSAFGKLWIALTPVGLWFLAMSFLSWDEARKGAREKPKQPRPSGPAEAVQSLPAVDTRLARSA